MAFLSTMSNVYVPLARNVLRGETRLGQGFWNKKSIMKKLLVLSVVAVTILALSGQRATAWKQFKFGVGLNLEGSGGGNNFLWGAYKSQQPPAQGGGYPGAIPGGYPGAIPGGMGGGYGPNFDGGFGPNFGAAATPGYDIGQETPPPPTPLPANPTPNRVQPVDYQAGFYGQNLYRPVGYAPAAYQLTPYWPGR
jgi:hypothetical protein